ncbi:hypothetical protein [Roseovarius pelagicus]|uniref:Uncharacterized protein n=1 Tax=Roseovarius pelagicus TaxID=2980108 RepID=A0ABY6DAK5_9RHOB|nr:hypothetical protein [Roseovarius pelagicus]UXX83125.1 hypothetical protein N7U68_18935 [Roseovarius pelagicus]
MSKLAGLASGQMIGVASVAVAAIVAVGLYAAGVFAPVSQPDPAGGTTSTSLADMPAEPATGTEGTAESEIAARAPTADATTTPETIGTDTAVAEDPATPELEAQVAAQPNAPRIDVFRLEPGGSMLVAGSSAPGWMTEILIDGTLLADAAADGNGQFVQFVKLEHSDQPRILSLVMTSPETGDRITSPDEVIIAPNPAAVATVETVDAPENEAAPSVPDGTEPAPLTAEATPPSMPDTETTADIQTTTAAPQEEVDSAEIASAVDANPPAESTADPQTTSAMPQAETDTAKPASDTAQMPPVDPTQNTIATSPTELAAVAPESVAAQVSTVEESGANAGDAPVADAGSQDVATPDVTSETAQVPPTMETSSAATETVQASAPEPTRRVAIANCAAIKRRGRHGIASSGCL